MTWLSQLQNEKVVQIESDEFPFNKHWFYDANNFEKFLGRLVFNSLLQSTLQSDLAKKFPMTQKFLAKPLVGY
jgi:heme oxygenase